MSPTNLESETNRTTSATASFTDPNATVALAGELASGSVCHSNGKPIHAVNETIRARAHSKWESAGCPAGDGVEFWLAAEREVNAELGATSSTQG